MSQSKSWHTAPEVKPRGMATNLRFGLERSQISRRCPHACCRVTNEPLKHLLNIALLKVLVACAGEDSNRDSSKQSPGGSTNREVHAPCDLPLGEIRKRSLESSNKASRHLLKLTSR